MKTVGLNNEGKFTKQRMQLLNAICINKIPQPIHLTQLITTPHTNKLTEHLIDYINTSNINI
jgi:hypothetical protein